MKENIKEKSPLYAIASFNADGTEVTLTLGSNEPKVCKSTLSVAKYLKKYMLGLLQTLNTEERQNADVCMFETVKNQLMTASNLPDIHDEDDIGDILSMLGIPFGGLTMLGMIVAATGRSSRQKNYNVTKLVENPVFEICPNCQRHGSFVDASTGKEISDNFWNKEDALRWIEETVAKGFLQPQKAKALEAQVNGGKRIAQTEKEFTGRGFFG